MKIYAPKLEVTNTDETAPEMARITYGGKDFPLKAKLGETLTVTNTDESAPEVSTINYGGKSYPIKVPGGNIDVVECRISADDYDDIKALIFAENDFTSDYTLKSVNLSKLGTKKDIPKIFWIRREGDNTNQGLYFLSIGEVAGDATHYYGTWGTAFFYNDQPDRKDKPIICQFYQYVINGELINKLNCKYIGNNIPALNIENVEDGQKIASIDFNNRSENIYIPYLYLDNTDETAQTIATIKFGDVTQEIKANIGGSGGDAGELKTVTGNITAEDWTKISQMAITSSSLYITLEDFQKPTLKTGELFRLKLGKKDDTGLGTTAAAVLTYNEYGVYTGTGSFFFGGNIGSLYIVQGLFSDTDHRIQIWRIK